jgi:hypothetical protein
MKKSPARPALVSPADAARSSAILARSPKVHHPGTLRSAVAGNPEVAAAVPSSGEAMKHCAH